jgi:hypothetical protein
LEEETDAAGEIQNGWNVGSEVSESQQVSLGDTIRILHQKKTSPKTLESLCLDYCANNAYQMLAWHKIIDLRKFF